MYASIKIHEIGFLLGLLALVIFVLLLFVVGLATGSSKTEEQKEINTSLL